MSGVEAVKPSDAVDACKYLKNKGFLRAARLLGRLPGHVIRLMVGASDWLTPVSLRLNTLSSCETDVYDDPIGFARPMIVGKPYERQRTEELRPGVDEHQPVIIPL